MISMAQQSPDLQTEWNANELERLSQQLRAAGYDLPFGAGSAALIATLFRDVVKGARYGKSAHKL